MWKYDDLSTGYRSFNSARLYYSPRDPTVDIGVEIVRGPSGIRGYLFVNQRQIVPFNGDPSQALVTYIIDGHRKDLIAKRFAGGHRVLLPEEAMQEMIAAWERESSVRLMMVGDFESHIYGVDFAQGLAKLEQHSIEPKGEREPFKEQPPEEM